MLHVGSHLGAGFEAGLERGGAGPRGGARALLTDRPGSCSRTRPAPAARSGARWTSSPSLFDRLDHHPRLGLCLDSCHLWVSGVDVTDPARLAATLERDRRAHRPRPAPLPPRERRRRRARLEPRPARERPRRADGRGPRRLPRRPPRPGPTGDPGDARARTATAPTRPRCSASRDLHARATGATRPGRSARRPGRKASRGGARRTRG